MPVDMNKYRPKDAKVWIDKDSQTLMWDASCNFAGKNCMLSERMQIELICSDV